MLHLSTLRDDVINKNYDLVLFDYTELKDLVLSNFGMSSKELRENFDSIVVGNVVKNKDLIELFPTIQKEYAKNYAIYREEFLSDRYDKLNNLFLQFVYPKENNLFTNDDLLSTVNVLQKTEYKQQKVRAENRMVFLLKTVDSLVNELKNFNKEQYINFYLEKTELMVEDLHILKNNDLFLLGVTNLNKMEITLDDLLSLNDNASRISWYSPTYKEYLSIESRNSNAQYSIEKFSERKELALHGMETYPFVLEKNGDDYFLLDGFNRLFGNDFDIPNKQVIVKIYDKLNTLEYSKILHLNNDWKISVENSFNKKYTKQFLDRGVRASLYFKYQFKGVELNELGEYSFDKDIPSTIAIHRNLLKMSTDFVEENISKNKEEFIKALVTIGKIQKLDQIKSEVWLETILSDHKKEIIKLQKYSKKSTIVSKIREILDNE